MRQPPVFLRNMGRLINWNEMHGDIYAYLKNLWNVLVDQKILHLSVRLCKSNRNNDTEAMTH